MRNANSALKHMTRKTAKLSKEQEISFAQRNPPIVQQFTQCDGEVLEQLKTDLKCRFTQCKAYGKQQWRQDRCTLEQERLTILEALNAEMKKDSQHLKAIN